MFHSLNLHSGYDATIRCEINIVVMAPQSVVKCNTGQDYNGTEDEMGYQITSTPLSFSNLRTGWWLGVVAVTAFHYQLSGYIETDLINCAYIYIYIIWLIYIWMTEQVEYIIQWWLCMVTNLQWLDATLIVVIKMIGAVGRRGWPPLIVFFFQEQW